MNYLFDCENLKDPAIKEINRQLKRLNLQRTLLVLSRAAKTKYYPKSAIQETGLSPDDIFFSPGFLPEWELAYMSQQAIYLSNEHKRELMEFPDLYKFQRLLIEQIDPILDEDNLTNDQRTAAMIRRIKNTQYPYDNFPHYKKLMRMLKILEQGDLSYDYKDRFKTATNGIEHDVFVTLCMRIDYELNMLFKNNTLDKDIYLLDSDVVSVDKDTNDKFFKLLTLNHTEFKCLYEQIMKEQIDKLNSDGQDGKELYYKLHTVMPNVLRHKPLFYYDKKQIMCPSPKMFEFFYNEFISRILFDQDKMEFTHWFGKAFENYCKEVTDRFLNKTYQILYEKQYYEEIKGSWWDGPADISILFDDIAVMFECKNFTTRMQGVITGRESPNQNEWTNIQKRLLEIVLQVFKHIKILKTKLSETKVQNEFKHIKRFFPFIVTYRNIYDINTPYENVKNDCLKFLSSDKRKEIGNINDEEINFVVISPDEFELLIVLLAENKKLFIECLNELFTINCFYMRVLGKDDISPQRMYEGAYGYQDREIGEKVQGYEPFEIIAKYCEKAGLDYRCHKQYQFLEEYFKDLIKKANKKIDYKDPVITKS